MDYHKLEDKELSQIVEDLSNGTWMKTLSKDERRLLEEWISDMRIGGKEYPNLVVSLDVGIEDTRPIVMYKCKKIEKELRTRVDLPGIIYWFEDDGVLPMELLQTPILDLDSLSIILGAQKNGD